MRNGREIVEVGKISVCAESIPFSHRHRPSSYFSVAWMERLDGELSMSLVGRIHFSVNTILQRRASCSTCLRQRERLGCQIDANCFWLVPRALRWPRRFRKLAKSFRGETGRLSLGLSGLAYWIGFCPLLNWQKMASPYDVTRSIGGKLSGKAAFDGGYVNSASGEIANPVPSDAIAFTREFYASPGIGNTAGGYDFSRRRLDHKVGRHRALRDWWPLRGVTVDP